MTIPSEEGFVVDTGRADKGRTFVRVCHVETGRYRTQVGLDGSTTNEIAKRLARELVAEIKTLSQH